MNTAVYACSKCCNMFRRSMKHLTNCPTKNSMQPCRDPLVSASRSTMLPPPQCPRLLLSFHPVLLSSYFFPTRPPSPLIISFAFFLLPLVLLLLATRRQSGSRKHHYPAPPPRPFCHSWSLFSMGRAALIGHSSCHALGDCLGA